MNTKAVFRQLNAVKNNSLTKLTFLGRPLLFYWRLLRQSSYIIANGEYDCERWLIFSDRQVCFLVISKAACTSIRCAIGSSYGIAVDGSQNIHDEQLWYLHQGKLSKFHNEYYKFCFVRNPFERLVSCYLDCIVTRSIKNGRESNWYDSYIYPIPSVVSFAEFVQIITSIPDRISERHFKSQSYWIYHKNTLKVDFIGRVEYIKEDWKKMADRFNFVDKIPHENRSDTLERDYDYRKYYDVGLAKMVYRRYRNDVELLGYKNDYIRLLDYLSN